jgi:hypothetical protein
LLTFSLRTRKLDLSVKVGRLIVLGVLLALSPATKPVIDELGANDGPAITMGQHAMAAWLGTRARPAVPAGGTTRSRGAAPSPASGNGRG